MTDVRALDAARIETLAGGFSGALLQPADDRYEAARLVHNGLIDRRPALIARCLGAADVANAVRFAREAGLEIAVRGGGHNIAGRCVTDGGLMIDLAEMKGMYVDPRARSIRAQGGVVWSEFNREAAVHGLAATGGAISTTGIAGLTLGGGLGWLMGIHGLAADNLISVELVNADGEVLNVTADSDPDLFWALRGGGRELRRCDVARVPAAPTARGRRRARRPPLRSCEGRPPVLPRVHAIGTRRADRLRGARLRSRQHGRQARGPRRLSCRLVRAGPQGSGARA